MSESEEMVDVIDLDNQVVEVLPRSLVRSRNLLHRGVGILCCNSRGETYVHRRTPTKDVFPGMYDMFVGGVVESGERYHQAAAREIAEELGIRGAPPDYLFTHLYLGERNRSRIQVYRVLWDGPIRWQPEEIEWGDWLPESDLADWVSTVPVVPDGLEVFYRYLEWKAEGSDRQAAPEGGGRRDAENSRPMGKSIEYRTVEARLDDLESTLNEYAEERFKPIHFIPTLETGSVLVVFSRKKKEPGKHHRGHYEELED
ncbi:MAG: NUDIX domain-containing protein [Armatimonadetes bacterium]|nr:NUDIX domain-containing protein [Armatimonadota bacterium]